MYRGRTGFAQWVIVIPSYFHWWIGIRTEKIIDALTLYAITTGMIPMYVLHKKNASMLCYHYFGPKWAMRWNYLNTHKTTCMEGMIVPILYHALILFISTLPFLCLHAQILCNTIQLVPLFHFLCIDVLYEGSINVMLIAVSFCPITCKLLSLVVLLSRFS